MDVQLLHVILERLALDETTLGADPTDLILAACEGPAELRTALGGGSPARSVDSVQPELEVEPPGAYLSTIRVQGFRGVGPRASLELEAGPGLTLVMGRNGSGKSSFAEGLELLMTGANARWHNRTKVWTEGWQNLHFDDATELEAELRVDGTPGSVRLRRRWARGEPVGPGELTLGGAPGGAKSLEELGWAAGLSRYRPFLSYNELGQMFDELKTMYDALAAILGLEDLDALAGTLRDARLERERALRALREQAKAHAQALSAVDDPRIPAIEAALLARTVDLDTIDLTLEGSDDRGDPVGEVAALRSLSSLHAPGPDAIDAAFDALERARSALAKLSSSDAGRAASLADLLAAALEHDHVHAAADCPVCGTAGVIDDAWRSTSRAAVENLRAEAQAVHLARTGFGRAQRDVIDLLPAGAPPVVAEAPGLGLDPTALLADWQAWSRARESLGSPEERDAACAALMATHMSATALREAAEAELARRQDIWRPVARRLAEWLPQARQAATGSDRLPALKAAEAWVKNAAAELQAHRLAPIADAARANWETLRQQSNVSLDGFHLRRSGNSRAAEVDVRVDGSQASAFGVMSQGELHALAVSVFLPRAALAESPFRFMVIDDPVQSMDPAKVDGLARVLESAAKARQVIVFTHDERLAEATRRLGIPARQLEVTRRPGSQVEVRVASDPVERYIADARALLREETLAEEVVRRVVPGFCRHALEAGCVTAIRRRRLGRGDRHADVEAALGQANRLNTHLALALFDDPGRGGDVLGSVRNRWGAPRASAVVNCNRGAHEPLEGDLRDLVSHSAVLARELAALQ